MSPQVIVTFLYPKTATSHFDMDYYLSQHIPTCKSLWEPLGMKSVYVCGVEGDQADYATETVLIWKDMASWGSANSSPSMQKLVADMKNFTNVTPVTVVGKVVG